MTHLLLKCKKNYSFIIFSSAKIKKGKKKRFFISMQEQNCRNETIKRDTLHKHARNKKEKCFSAQARVIRVIKKVSSEIYAE